MTDIRKIFRNLILGECPECVKTAREIKERNEREENYYKFWKGLIQYYDSVKPGFKNKKSTSAYWYTYESVKPGMEYVFCFDEEKYPSVCLNINGPDDEENRKILQKLKLHSGQIDSKLHELEWFDEDWCKNKSISLQHNKEYNVLSQDENEKKETLQWFSSNMQTLENILTPLIK